MGVSVEVDLDMRPITVDLVFPKGIEEGGRVSLNFWRSSCRYGLLGEATEKSTDRSVCGGSQVAVVRKRSTPVSYDHAYAFEKIKVCTYGGSDATLCYLSESAEVPAKKQKCMSWNDKSDFLTAHDESVDRDGSESRDPCYDSGMHTSLPDILSSDESEQTTEEQGPVEKEGQHQVREPLNIVEVTTVQRPSDNQLNLEKLVQSLLNSEQQPNDAGELPSPEAGTEFQQPMSHQMAESNNVVHSIQPVQEKEALNTQAGEQSSEGHQPVLTVEDATAVATWNSPRATVASKKSAEVSQSVVKKPWKSVKSSSIVFVCSYCSYKCGSREAAIDHCNVHIDKSNQSSTVIVGLNTAKSKLKPPLLVANASGSPDSSVPLISNAFSLNAETNVKVTADDAGLVLDGESGKLRLVRSKGTSHRGAVFIAMPLEDKNSSTAKRSSPSKSEKSHRKGTPSKTFPGSPKALFKCFKCEHETYDRAIAIQHLSFHTIEKKADPMLSVKQKTQESFACGKCGKTFNVKSGYMKHMRRHVAPKKFFECTYCSRRFTSRPTLDSHVRIHTQDYTFKCDQCAKGYMAEELLEKHKTRCHSDPVFCTDCNLPFKLERNLTYHMIKHHSLQTEFKCDKCSNYFPDLQDLARHHERCGKPDTSRHCLYCSFDGPTYADLTSHVIQCHPEANTYKCHTCSKVFVHLEKLKAHEKGHKESGSSKRTSYKCPVCSKQMHTQGGLQSHLCSHNQMRPYKCSLCDAALTSKGNLRLHTINAHGTTKYTCDQCPKECKSLSTLRRHVAKMHEQTLSHECEQCHKRFNSEQRLQKHMALIHMGDTEMITKDHNPFPLIKPFTCDVCMFSTFSPYRIKAHRITHTGIMPFQCNTCDKSFVVQDELTRHIVLAHSQGRGSYPCIHCKRTFFAKQRYDYHVQLHEMGSGFCCPQCGYLYESKAYLEHHMQCHSAVENFKCNLCERAFKVSRGLAIHMFQSHPETRKYHTLTMLRSLNYEHPCDQCLMKFKTSAELRAHKLIRHLGIHPPRQTPTKRYACSQCPRVFTFNCELVHHMRIHTGETPYECEHCQKKFRYAHSLRKHVTVMHTKDFKFFCPLCKKGFVDNAKVRQHLKSAHKAVGNSVTSTRRSCAKSAQVVVENDASQPEKTASGLKKRLSTTPAVGTFVTIGTDEEAGVEVDTESAVALLQTLF